MRRLYVGLLGLVLAGCGAEDVPFVMARPGQAITVPVQGLRMGIANPAMGPQGAGGGIPDIDNAIQLQIGKQSFEASIEGTTHLTEAAAAIFNGGGSLDSEIYNLKISTPLFYALDAATGDATLIPVDGAQLRYAVPKAGDLYFVPVWQADAGLLNGVAQGMVYVVVAITPR